MKQKIFITGISSEIILSLIKHIDLSEFEIYGLSRAPEEISSALNIRLIKGDIKDIDLIKNHLIGSSIIIHAAAITHTSKTKEYFQINLKATIDIIDLANHCGIKKFIFISSNTAGEKSGAYGKSKFLAEKYIEDNFHSWLILRPAEVYGSRNKEGIERFISGTIKTPLSFYPVGVRSKLSPVYLHDVGEIFHKVIFKEQLTHEKITICGPQEYTFSELIELIIIYKKNHLISIPVSKYLMFFIEKVIRIIPFPKGLKPDQIPRLYSRKNIGTTMFRSGRKSLEIYLKERVSNKNGAF